MPGKIEFVVEGNGQGFEKCLISELETDARARDMKLD